MPHTQLKMAPQWTLSVCVLQLWSQQLQWRNHKMPKINAIKNVAQTKLKLLLLPLRKNLATKWLWANEVIAALTVSDRNSTPAAVEIAIAIAVALPVPASWAKALAWLPNSICTAISVKIPVALLASNGSKLYPNWQIKRVPFIVPKFTKLVWHIWKLANWYLALFKQRTSKSNSHENHKEAAL